MGWMCLWTCFSLECMSFISLMWMETSMAAFSSTSTWNGVVVVSLYLLKLKEKFNFNKHPNFNKYKLTTTTANFNKYKLTTMTSFYCPSIPFVKAFTVADLEEFIKQHGIQYYKFYWRGSWCLFWHSNLLKKLEDAGCFQARSYEKFMTGLGKFLSDNNVSTDFIPWPSRDIRKASFPG